MEDEYRAGWRTHPGTHCGHYFPAGEVMSLCKRERRGAGGDILNDCSYQCAICKERVKEPLTANLFAGENQRTAWE